MVGRPNVGKSTLVNRIIGRREAVVQDVPGVTRDRVSYDADWNGKRFVLVDTGGWAPDAKGMAAQIAEQAELAIAAADAVLFVVDATVGTQDVDEAVVQILRRSGKPVVLAANKVDDQRTEAEAATMWNLGLGEPFPVSALHGRGSGDLLDAILDAIPEAPREVAEVERGPRRVAIVGKPNVGKSSLLNKVARPAAGRRRQRRRHHGRPGRRAGRGRRHHLQLHRHRGHPAPGQGGVGPRVLRLAAHPRRDRAGRGLRRRHRRQRAGHRAGPAHPHLGRGGRPRAWSSPSTSGTSPTRSAGATSTARSSATSSSSAGPRTSTSPPTTGRHVDRLGPAIQEALAGWETRISTGKLNAFLGRIVAAHPHPVRGGKQPRILFGTQAQAGPPTFVLFTSGQIDPGYVRFVERRLREEFGFVGTPVHVEVRAREKRKDRS